MDSKERFLNEVRHRRNMFWVFLIAMWFLGMVVIHLLFAVAFKSSPVRLETYIDYGWEIGAFILAFRSSRVRCPRCGKIATNAIQQISIRHVRCRWCDYPNENEEFEKLGEPETSAE